MAKARIVIDRERCKECLLCILACKKALIVTTAEFNSRGYHPVASKDGDECTGCTLCAVTCPEAAIEVYRG
jgi:2-oxoglutarate ferredoxin oxidoreductase subunit delta